MWIARGLVAMVGVAMGCGSGDPGVAATAATATPAPAAVGRAGDDPAPTWAEALTRIDARIAESERLAAAHADDWARFQAVADGYAERARWTGSYDDYGKAFAALDRAFAIAPEGSGPLLSRARLQFAVHRLDAVAPDVDRYAKRVLLDDDQKAEIAAIRGDLAYQRGDMDGAEALYRASAQLHASLPSCYGLVQLDWHRGRFEDALAGLDGCEATIKGPAPTTRLWLDLQRGEIEADRGRHAEALAHYAEADARVSGHWLVAEKRAASLVALGRDDEALAIYEAPPTPVDFVDPKTGAVLWSYDIARETGNPAFLDGIAGIYLRRGDAAGAAGFAAKAGAVYARELEAWPEAAAGHALDHALAWGDDPAAAVALAERNAAVRPNGEASTLLATALRRANQLDPADAAIARALATGWNTAATHVEAARIAEARGDGARAAAAWARARALDPTR